MEGPGPGAQRDPHVPSRLVGGRQVRLRADPSAETGGPDGHGAQNVDRPEHQQPGTVGEQVRGGGQGATGCTAIAFAVAQAVCLVHPVRVTKVRAKSV